MDHNHWQGVFLLSNIWYIWILLALEHVCYWHLAIEIYLLAMSSTSWMKVSWRNNWNIFQQKFTASVALFEILHSVLFQRSFFNLRKKLAGRENDYLPFSQLKYSSLYMWDQKVHSLNSRRYLNFIIFFLM